MPTKNYKKKIRKYQYFINEEGKLVMQPERFKDTNVFLTCRLSAKSNDNHEHKVYLY